MTIAQLSSHFQKKRWSFLSFGLLGFMASIHFGPLTASGFCKCLRVDMKRKWKLKTVKQPSFILILEATESIAPLSKG